MSSGLLDLRLHNCERCGFTYRKKKLVRDNGLLVCKACVDDLDPYIPQFALGAPRADSDTTTAVNSPVVFSITTAGITSLGNSTEIKSPDTVTSFIMYVVGSAGAVTVTANPAIVAGIVGNIINLIGTSDTNTVTLNDGNGLTLRDTMILGKDAVWNGVWDTTTSTWVETSRGYNTLS